MGTRNLTMVISGGKTRIAQYGQWDGYPSGQGATVLAFLKSKKNNLDGFRAKLERIRFIDDAKNKEIKEFLSSMGSTDGWMNDKQADAYHAKYPYLTRDHGAKILELVDKSEDEIIWLHDEAGFAADSLFCEWAYVVDLDKMKLEVYKGFNKKPLGVRARFKYLEEKMRDREDKYYPIVKTATFDINNLPETEAEFEAKCYHKKLKVKAEKSGDVIVTAFAGKIE